jgi:phage tail protein X
MFKAALVAALAALTMAACGSVGAGGMPSPSPSPSQSIVPGPGFDAVATEKDTQITIRAGQKLELVLHANPGMSNWGNVRSSDPSVLEPTVNPAATAVRGVTLAAFHALAPGEATITASAGVACSPGQACPMLAVLYRLTVTVSS